MSSESCNKPRCYSKIFLSPTPEAVPLITLDSALPAFACQNILRSPNAPNLFGVCVEFIFSPNLLL